MIRLILLTWFCRPVDGSNVRCEHEQQFRVSRLVVHPPKLVSVMLDGSHVPPSVARLVSRDGCDFPALAVSSRVL